jgi:hypothetical protein
MVCSRKTVLLFAISAFLLDQSIPNAQSSVTRTNPKKTTDTVAKATRFFRAALLSIPTWPDNVIDNGGDVNNYMCNRQGIFPEHRKKRSAAIFEREARFE